MNDHLQEFRVLIRELLDAGETADTIICEVAQNEINYNNADKTSGQTCLENWQIAELVKEVQNE
jgi:hypothetical protein